MSPKQKNAIEPPTSNWNFKNFKKLSHKEKLGFPELQGCLTGEATGALLKCATHQRWLLQHNKARLHLDQASQCLKCATERPINRHSSQAAPHSHVPKMPPCSNFEKPPRPRGPAPRAPPPFLHQAAELENQMASTAHE